jgi:hypothetical protein
MRHASLLALLITVGSACAGGAEGRGEHAERVEDDAVPAAPAPDPVGRGGETGESAVAPPRSVTPATRGDTIDRGEEGDHRLRGRVAVVGNVPFTRPVIQAAGRQVELTGALEPELRRLAGAEVEVRGRRARGSLPGLEAIEVMEYEVLSVDGAAPHVGRLEEGEDGSWWLNTEEGRRRLSSVPESLRQRTGARIWVIGADGADGISVRSYGIIRP